VISRDGLIDENELFSAGFADIFFAGVVSCGAQGLLILGIYSGKGMAIDMSYVI